MTVETASARTPDLFGHPKGLTFLFTTEMWERFSYYGMRTLLVLYMVKHLLQPGQAETVIGYGAIKGALEFLFGPLGVQPLSSHIYGLYSAFVYLTPVIGGLIADRWLGQRRTVIVGAILMAIGHFMMAFESLFLFALFVLILGNGAFKPNISTQVGGLYAPGDPRRDRAFSIFYVGINIGAFFSPLVCGTLGEAYGWHYGFAAAGIGMLIGTLIYVAGWSTLPTDERSLRADQPQSAARSRRVAPYSRARCAVPAGRIVLGDLRAAGQHHCALGRRTDRPLGESADLAGADPGHLVSGLQPVHDLRLHPIRDRAVGVAGTARPRAIDRREDGSGLLWPGARQSRASVRRLAVRRRPGELAVAAAVFRRSSQLANSISRQSDCRSSPRSHRRAWFRW